MNSYRNQQCGYGIYRGVRYQRGNGIYRGVRYQHGNGFLNTILNKAVYPLLKYFGKQGVRTAMAIGKEAVHNPSASFGDIAKRKLKEAGMQALDDGAKRVQRFAQTGEGIKRSIKRAHPVKTAAFKPAKSTKKSKHKPSKKPKPTKKSKQAKQPTRKVAKKVIKRRKKARKSFLFE